MWNGRNAECGMRNAELKGRVRSPMLPAQFDGPPIRSAFRIPRSAFFAGLILLSEPGLAGAQALPPLPDQTGFGVHVLALARAPDDAIWVGSYGDGIFVLRPGAGTWQHLKHSTDTSA